MNKAGVWIGASFHIGRHYGIVSKKLFLPLTVELSCKNTDCLLLLPVAPIKALCSQCFESWKKKFGPLGLSCKELTGDTEIDDFFEIQDSHIILTTPVCETTLHVKTNEPYQVEVSP